jgi:Fe-S cluster assembly protein SufD
MGTPLTTRILEEYASCAPALGADDGGARDRALEALQAQGLPTSRDENWKYANLRALERQRFLPVAHEAKAVAALAGLPPALEGFSRYVFVDGLLQPALSSAPDATASLVSAGASAAPERLPAGDERFALLNQLFATGGAHIRVPQGSAGSRIELVQVASAESRSGAAYPRVDLSLEPQASCTLIERHVSAAGAASFVSGATTVSVGRGARLDHYRLQELNARSTLIDTLSADVAGEARYRLHAISTGAQAARSTIVVRLRGEHAQLTFGAAALGDAQQVQDSYCIVEHQLPQARSEQTFRGIAAGRARVAFNSKVVVAAGARGTDSRQSLRGLLAGPEAEIDVRPQLEIYTDDVRCSHGATAGKLDDNMLFYLLSRGLSRETAQRLLKWAFLEDVIAQIAVPALRRQIEERLAGQLRDDTLLELL